MHTRKRYHTPKFKSKVALAALKDTDSIPALTQKYAVSKIQIEAWTKRLISRSQHLFKSCEKEKMKAEISQLKKELQKYQSI